MIQILDKMFDKVTVFISEDEELYRIAAVFIKLLLSGYVVRESTAYDVILENQHIKGSRINLFKTSVYDINRSGSILNYELPSSDIKLQIALIPYSSLEFKISGKINLNNSQIQTMFNKYLEDTRRSEDNIMTLTCYSNIRTKELWKIENNQFKILESKEQIIDNHLWTIHHFEQNYSKLTNLMHLLYLVRPKTYALIKFGTYNRLAKYIDIISKIDLDVNIEFRKRFIDLLISFQRNKIVSEIDFKKTIELIKRPYDILQINLFGIPIIMENNFNKFKYIDQPSINFIVKFLELTNSLSQLEAKITKEIIINL